MSKSAALTLAPVQCPESLVRKLWLPNSLVTRSAYQLWHENGLKLLDHYFYNLLFLQSGSSLVLLDRGLS